jgi:hypothetical protein
MEEGKFNRLSLAERADLVWRDGKFADSVLCANYCLMLYSLNCQFVEVYVDLHNQSIVSINLANEYDLSKYLEDIHITV